MANEWRNTETVYHMIWHQSGRGGSLTAKNDAEAIDKVAAYDAKWGTKTQRIVKSVNTVIWRKEQ